jgi:hypothetical protein
MRYRLPLLLSLLLLPALAACTHTPAPPPAAESNLIPYRQWLSARGSLDNYADDPVLDSAADRAVRLRLDEEIEKFDADHMPFEKAINFLRDNSNISIFVYWKALEGAGIDRNTPVTAHLAHVPFRKALTTILSEVGGGTANLGYTIDDGVITVSTREDLDSAKYQLLRVYDIRDIIAAASSGPPPIVMLPYDVDPPKVSPRDTIVMQIAETVTSTVAPETWRVNGGVIGSIREHNGQFIINQTIDNQRKVSHLLAQLRETRTLCITVASRTLLLDEDAYADLAATLHSGVLDATQNAQFAAALRTAKPLTLSDRHATVVDGGILRADLASLASKAPSAPLLQPGYVISDELRMSADRRYVVARVTFSKESPANTQPTSTPPIGSDLPRVEYESPPPMVAIPDGQTALIPGPLVNADFPNPSRHPAPSKRLLVILTPTIMIDKAAAAALLPPPPRKLTYLGQEISVKEATEQSALIALAKFTTVTPSSLLSTYGVLQYDGQVQPTRILKGPAETPTLLIDFTLNSVVRNDAIPKVAEEWILFAEKKAGSYWVITKMLPLTPENRQALEQALPAATTQPAAASQPAAAPYVPPYTDEQAQAFAAQLPDLTYPTDMNAACKTLGIDPARLGRNGLLKTSTSGVYGATGAKLSPRYFITVQYPIWPKAGAIDRVLITKSDAK